MSGWFPGVRVAGVEVRVHALVLVVPCLLALSAPRGEGAVAGRVGAYAALLLAVLVHEAGHALVARRRGLGVEGIRLHAVGAWALVERRWPAAGVPADEWAVALGGPGANLLAAAAVSGLAALAGRWPAEFTPASLLSDPWRVLLASQAALGLGNLLPAFPADGGRVLRAALATPLGYRRATEVAAATGLGLALVAVTWALVWEPTWALPVLLAAGLLLAVGWRERAAAR